ncbi:MAG: MotA/TolQ/ExbB proton channel family protein [bacterium]|nr:MotA/TolQ/ExbB proton channel family protein [bacterium]
MNQEAFTLGSWWTQGGPVMYPLAVYSILGIAVLIEKLFFLRKISGSEIELVRKAADDLLSGKSTAESGAGPVWIILTRLRKLVGDGLGTDALVRAAEREVSRLEDIAMRGMIWLAIIGNTAPFVGLFGTVVGIIRAFHGLSGQGLPSDPSQNSELIRGISEALVSTATGLMVAVPAVIAYNYLLREIRSRIGRIDLACADYADAIGNGKVKK